jgi:hypothetical protein
MSAVATAACLHLAGGDKDFSATSPSLDFPDNWGTDTVMAVRPSRAATCNTCHDATMLLTFLLQLSQKQFKSHSKTTTDRCLPRSMLHC